MKKTLLRAFLAAFLAVFGVLAVPGASHASCSGSNRVSLSSASCLDGGYSNYCATRIFGKCVSWNSSHWVQATANCTRGDDKVVAKISLRNMGDRTWHRYNNARHQATSDAKTKGIYCCSDLGRCN